MSRGVSALVLVEAVHHGLLETLDSLERGSAAPAEILLLPLVSDLRAVDALRGLCTPGSNRRLLAEPFAPFDVAETPLVLVLAAGDVLDERFLAAAVDSLAADRGLGWVTSRLRTENPTGPPAIATRPASLAPASLLTDPWVLPRAALYVRDAVEAVGGLDLELGALASLDLWLRLTAAEWRGELLPGALVRRRPRNAPPPRVGEILDRFVTRHAALLRQLGPAIVVASQEELQHAAGEYRARLSRRDEALEAATRDEARIAAARHTMSAAGAGGVQWGELRATAPVSRQWGEDRGLPIDRHYIRAFIAAHRADLRGAVLEVQEDDLTERFGGGLVERQDVVDIDAGNAHATLLADLRHAGHVADGTYDCFVLTQTLHVIADMPGVLREAHRILKPGGVLLATLPATSRVCVEYGPEGDFWRTTEAGARELFRQVFGPDQVEVTPYGNLLTSVAFLHGLACHELTSEEFAAYDPWYPLLFGVRAVKPRAPQAASHRIAIERETAPAAVLLYHRVATTKFDPHHLAVDRDTFVEQMCELAARCRPCELGALARGAAAGNLPARSVAITFDDAYRDVLDVASPVLVELGLPATFFAVTRPLAAPAPFWWDVLAAILLGGETPPRLTLDLEGQRLELDTASADDRRRVHDQLHPRLVRAGIEARDLAMAQLASWAGPRAAEGLDGAMPLDEAGLRELAARPGHAIGAHGQAHLALAAMDAATREGEIGGAKRALEALLARPIDAFAYPYGDVDSSAARAVRAAGYALAVSCDDGAVTAGSDPWRLPRLEVHGESGMAFRELLDAAIGPR